MLFSACSAEVVVVGVVVLVVILLLVLPFETFIACCSCCDDDGFKDTGVVIKAEQTAAEHIAIAAIMRTILFIVGRRCRCLGRCSCRRSISLNVLVLL